MDSTYEEEAVKVLICGSRNWDHWGPIKDYLGALPDDAEIIEGGAAGADFIARTCALMRGLEVVEYPANWEKYRQMGRVGAAGPIRNRKMLDHEKPDLVVAFTYDLATSPGTRDMVREAHRRGIPVEVLPKGEKP